MIITQDLDQKNLCVSCRQEPAGSCGLCIDCDMQDDDDDGSQRIVECNCQDDGAYNCAWETGTRYMLDDTDIGSYEVDQVCNCPCHQDIW